MLNIALPKGRLGEKVLESLARGGFAGAQESGRQLVIRDDTRGVSYFWVKPSDVTVYVENGAADVGIAGKDIIMENAPDVYELSDLGIGACRMTVAGKKGERPDASRVIRVATKFPRIAREYYASISRAVEIIKLNGSIELAPLLDMSDVIVDIVETGRTLVENGLEVYETIAPISARLIANKSAYRFNFAEITALKNALEGGLQK